MGHWRLIFVVVVVAVAAPVVILGLRVVPVRGEKSLLWSLIGSSRNLDFILRTVKNHKGF